MAGVNIKKTTEGKVSQGGGFLKFKEGKTRLYVHPPCKEAELAEMTEGLPYIIIGVHYNVVGNSKAGVLSLNPDVNPFLEHPYIQKALKAKGIKLPKKCPIESFIENEASDDEADSIKLQTKFLWGATPVGFKAEGSTTWLDIAKKPSILMHGITVHNGLIDIFEEEEADITDPDGAIYAQVHRIGTTQNGTRYFLKADRASLKSPVSLDKKFRAELKKAMESDCNLFRLVASMIKSSEEIRNMLSGVETESDEEEIDRKPSKSRRRKAPIVEEEDDDEEEDEELDEEEEEEDEEEEPPPPPRRKASKKSSSRKPTKRSAKKPPVVEEEDDDEEDDDDLGLDDLEAELDEDEEEDEEPPPPPRRKASKKSSKSSRR